MGQGGGVAFRGRVRFWDEASGRGLAVVDVPTDLVAALGGRRQYRVTGTIAGAPFTGSGMLVAGGGYCVGVSKGALKAAGTSVGDEVEVSIARV
jgi:NaMN:DMB phosphoribosyltransferase